MAAEDIFRNQFADPSFSVLDGEDRIVKNAVRGESSAFGLLYDHYVPRIYRFVLIKVGGHREEAEDLTHQVFLSAWQHMEHYKDFGFPFSSWLYRIARNQVVDFYRTRKETQSIERVAEARLMSQDNLSSVLEQSFQFNRVIAAIRKLKPEYQDVVILRYVEDLSTKEISRAVQKTEGAVKLMQHRAIRELKKQMDAAET